MVLFSSRNFIKEVKNGLIQIQDKNGSKVYHSIDHRNVTTTFVENSILKVYRTNESDISLKFKTNSDAIIGNDLLRNSIKEIKSGSYNTTSNNLGDIYDHNTFIVDINIEDYTIQLINNKGDYTKTIVASSVISIHAENSQVIVKTDSTDRVTSLLFENNGFAIIGAKKLKIALKRITDRIPSDNGGVDIYVFYKEYLNKDVWVAEPDRDIKYSEISMEYLEYFKRDSDGITYTQECEGLVEYYGDKNTDILDKIIIRFSEPISGRIVLSSFSK